MQWQWQTTVTARMAGIMMTLMTTCYAKTSLYIVGQLVYTIFQFNCWWAMRPIATVMNICVWLAALELITAIAVSLTCDRPLTSAASLQLNFNKCNERDIISIKWWFHLFLSCRKPKYSFSCNNVAVGVHVVPWCELALLVKWLFKCFTH